MSHRILKHNNNFAFSTFDILLTIKISRSHKTLNNDEHCKVLKLGCYGCGGGTSYTFYD